MPRARDITRYPPEFSELLTTAAKKGKVEMNFPTYRKAYNFRARLYRYRRDVEIALDQETDGPLVHRLKLLYETIEPLETHITQTDEGARLLICDPAQTDPTRKLMRAAIHTD